MVDSTAGAQAALDVCVRARPNLVVTDLHLDDVNGLALLKELKSRWPSITVIIVTAHATIPEAVEATQCGAFGFLIKPLEKAELLGQVERAVAASTFSRVEGDWRSDIVARSQLMEERLGLANRAAGSDEPVLLTGENGTGKELLARAIHAGSARRDQAFIAVRCRDAGEDQLEIDLFGRPAMAIVGEPARDPGAGRQGSRRYAAAGLKSIGYRRGCRSNSWPPCERGARPAMGRGRRTARFASSARPRSI